MSVQASTWVWKNSKATGGTLLVALAIADAANAQGENSCQAVESIASLTRVSESTVHRAIAWLLAEGELEWVGVNEFYNHTRIYRFPLMGGVTMTPGGVSSATEMGVMGDTQTQKDNPKTKTSSLSARKRATQIPSDFSPDAAMLAWWRENGTPGVDVMRETEQFRDHWLGKGEVRKDWPASWRTWMRNAAKFATNSNHRSTSTQPNMSDGGFL